MKQSFPYWQVAGFLFTSILGTFLHFLFDLSGQNVIAAIFSAVNESIWEHMKLIYYPMFLFALIEYRFWGKNHKQFWCIKLVGILIGLTLIPVLYYTYTGIFGVSVDLQYHHLFPFGWCCVLGRIQAVPKGGRMLSVLPDIFFLNLPNWRYFHPFNILCA